MNYWLMKSEPDDCSIDDLIKLPEQIVGWTGVRNYQARNFMRDQMSIDDGVLFYHSSCKQPGIAGLARICSHSYPDPNQFNPQHRYYDPKAKAEQPRWWQVDVQLVNKIKFIPLTQLRQYPELADMRILQRGNRLSITPVSEAEWHFIQQLSKH